MMVTFISQCEKKALSRTRRVLDAFADRIGDNAWRTVITQEGLDAVKKLLRKSASKNTAVACHWARSRTRSELVWIVGNRKRFNNQGLVPVNSTQSNLLHKEWENDWHHLPVLKALVAVAALLHDWGKATALFQAKLQSNTKLGDPLRHEWISCLLLNALVQAAGNTDEGWLNMLASGNLDEAALEAGVTTNVAKPLANLPPIAQVVGWLILTHHRLPAPEESREEADQTCTAMAALLAKIPAAWGYANQSDEERKRRCFQFPHGLLSQSAPWHRQLRKWAIRLLAGQQPLRELLENGAYRLLLHHARLSLMLGDHYYSSCSADGNWRGLDTLFANTDRDGSLKQKLDEHLVGVSAQALRVSQSLARFTTDMATAYDIKALKQRSKGEYDWQDKAVEVIAGHRKTLPNNTDAGWFVVNMASTGCGKTFANAKIMRALSTDGDSLRFVLALGLRTLTLQTGDEYRERIGLGRDELAVLIGSAAVQELHERAKRQAEEAASYEDAGSESMETLLDEELICDEGPRADFLATLFPSHQSRIAEKNQAFLYVPVLVCTLDHIIAATETTRGGKYILPCLRLLSSDLVLDEVDDFDSKDLIAIGRLIHLAGMLGRKVMISSATIPPAVAEGLFNTYQEGWCLHAAFKRIPSRVAAAWVDEFRSQAIDIDLSQSQHHYRECHQGFVSKRVKKLLAQPVRRRALVHKLPETLLVGGNPLAQQQDYFAAIRDAALNLHQSHHTVDAITGKRVSFGVVRVANIAPCVALSRYLLDAEWPEHCAPRILTYHSRQVLLLRHEQEQHLDVVLKRKEEEGEPPKALADPQIRRHLDTTSASDVLFILVATPVEEVGRDHDLDWAVVEPSSYRSIIQLAGRVWRHRKWQSAVGEPNMAILQYNLRAMRQFGAMKNAKPQDWLRIAKKPVFQRPGYETNSQRLATFDLYQLVDEKSLSRAVTAIPRIQEPATLRPTQQLADLEHSQLRKHLTRYEGTGPGVLQGWLTEYWWLTALPQRLNRFRDGNKEANLYLLWREGRAQWCERTERGEYIPAADLNNIVPAPALSSAATERLWLQRDYIAALQRQAGDEEDSPSEQRLTEASRRFGEITFPGSRDRGYYYADQFGLYPREG